MPMIFDFLCMGSLDWLHKLQGIINSSAIEITSHELIIVDYNNYS